MFPNNVPFPGFFQETYRPTLGGKKRPPHPQAGAPQLAKLLYNQHDYSWLVVYLPLWKIWKSVGVTIPNYGKMIQMFQTTNQL